MLKDVLLNAFANIPYFIVSTYKSLFSGLAACYKFLTIAFIILLTLFSLSYSSLGHSSITNAKHSEDLSLTVEEQHWLEKHSEITLAYDGHYPPYSFLISHVSPPQRSKRCF